MNCLISTILLTAALFVGLAAAAPPGILNHQGRIAVGGTNFDGTGHFKFALVDSTGNVFHWSNSPDAILPTDGIPDEAVSIAVNKGHYSVALGDATIANMNGPIPDSIFAENSELYLRVWFSTLEVGPFEELTPKRRLTSAAFSLHATKAAGIVDGGVTESMLAAGSVTTPKLAGGAVDNTILAPGAAGENIDAAGSVGIGLGGADPSAAVQLDGDVSYPDPALLAQIKDGDPGFDELGLADFVFVSGTTAYVTAANDSALTIVDVADPSSPVVLAVLKDGVNGFDELGGARGVFVSGTTAYVAAAGDDALTIIDVSAPATPVLLAVVKDGVGGFDELNGAWAVQVVGKIAYVVSRVDSSLTIIDVSVPASPGFVAMAKDGVGGFDHLADPRALFVSGTNVYVPSFQDHALTIIDVSTPASPAPLGVAIDGVGGFNALEGARSVHVSGKTAVVTGFDDNALTLVDVSTASSPKLIAEIVDGVGGFDHMAGARFVDVSGSTACVASFFDDSLTFIDISSPASPTLIAEVVDGVGGFDELNGASGVHFSGAIAYAVSNNDDSLTIIDTSFETLVDLATRNRVGIGTARPDALLHVAGDGIIDGGLQIGSQLHVAGEGIIGGGLQIGSQLHVAGDGIIDGGLQIGSQSDTDDDAIFFDDGVSESLIWDDSEGRFALSAGLFTESVLHVAGPSPAGPTGETLRLEGTETTSAAGTGAGISFTGYSGGQKRHWAWIRGLKENSTVDSVRSHLSFATRANGDPTETMRLGGTGRLTGHGPLHVTASGEERFYNYFSVGDPDPATTFVVDPSDLYVDDVLEVGGFLVLDGTLLMGSEDGSQTIGFFDDGFVFGESLRWDDTRDLFEFSNDLRAKGSIQFGFFNPSAVVPYNRGGNDTTSHSLDDGSDLLISDDLEVNGTVFADGDIEVGARLYLNGQMRMGAMEGDQSIYFFNAGSSTAERLAWDDSEGGFLLSGPLAIDGVIRAGGSGTAATTPYNYFASSPPVPASGDITNSGDVYIDRDLEVQQTVYCQTLVEVSDRNRKEKFAPVDASEVLEKVAGLPLSTWQFKETGEEPEAPVRHLGPMAQDFHAAFGIGLNDRTIAKVDADGVALAAIQGLNAKLEAENAELRKRLEKLERAIDSLADRITN